MSIIEKAASRIDHTRNTPAPAAVPVETDEQVVALNQHAAPAAAAAPAPAAPAIHAVPLETFAPTPAESAAAAVASATASGSASATAAAAHAAPAQPHIHRAPSGKHSARKVDLDLARMRDAGMVTAASGRTSLLEDFRVIKRPLLKRAFGEASAPGRPNNLIMVTSSLPGEGKTYCAINLAMSIAMELDHTVLLVDADVARPSVLRTLGLPAQRGLMDILIDDKLDLSDVMLRTNVDTLSILPAGTSTPRATELLASSTMSNMVNEIANRYPDRVIIFDSPPLLLTSESRVLASHMGQIVMVVEAQTTTQHAVKESLRQLEGCSNVNLIYNKARDIPGIEETYDYHYG
ncbi:XrtA-associated tyrosine autokinase [Massilia sp. YIM B02769]|uniref:XrtA-associated tyrosine autokinase n=1 Tax=unclassified Massilia TaxID=2609279 RepID=UPI0025B63D8D|nr:XrtA-associated tyrosine autokinase [Massilia sp.]MDN4057008.1 XrtA-associated tyrosine autokinase [Massilia sp. YIM B02769]